MFRFIEIYIIYKFTCRNRKGKAAGRACGTAKIRPFKKRQQQKYKRPSTDEASDGTDIILPTPGDSSSGGTDLSFIDSVVVILNKIIELILNISKVPW